MIHPAGPAWVDVSLRRVELWWLDLPPPRLSGEGLGERPVFDLALDSQQRQPQREHRVEPTVQGRLVRDDARERRRPIRPVGDGPALEPGRRRRVKMPLYRDVV